MFWKPKDLQFTNIIICGLATWRVSSVLVHEDGPFEIFDKLRDLIGIKYDSYGNMVEGTETVLSCLWCTAFWVSLVLYILPSPIRNIFAANALAIIVEEKLIGDGKS